MNHSGRGPKVAVDDVVATKPRDRRRHHRDTQTRGDQGHDGLHLHSFLGDAWGETRLRAIAYDLLEQARPELAWEQHERFVGEELGGDRAISSQWVANR